MKKILIICIVVCTLFPGKNFSIAQGLDKKFCFGLDIGYSSPSGDFSSTNQTKQPIVLYPSTDTTHIAGYAKGGMHFNAYATYMFGPHVGAMLSIGGSLNKYDVSTLNSEIYAISIANGPGWEVIPSFTTNKEYFIGQYLIGPYIQIPLTNKLNLEFKGLFGLTSSNYPTLSYSSSFIISTYGQIETWATSNSYKTSLSFGYNIGAGLKYMITDVLGLHFNLCYGGAAASYSSYTETGTTAISAVTYGSSTIPGSTSQINVTHKTPTTMSIGLIEVTVGASIDL